MGFTGRVTKVEYKIFAPISRRAKETSVHSFAIEIACDGKQVVFSTPGVKCYHSRKFESETKELRPSKGYNWATVVTKEGRVSCNTRFVTRRVDKLVPSVSVGDTIKVTGNVKTDYGEYVRLNRVKLIEVS